jgi:hypothetical protein
MARWVGLWLLCVACVVPLGMRSDPHVAAALAQTAQELAPTEPLDRVWLEAARVNSTVLPWQPGYGEARLVVNDVAQARRAALVDDRGGRRAPLLAPVGSP